MEEPVILRIKPRPAPRPRLGKNGAYNESWYTKYKKDLIFLLKSAKIPLHKKYNELYVVFGLPYPKTVKGGQKMKIEGAPHFSDSGDVDNFTKGIKDALQQAGIIENDCMIYHESCTKLWTCTDGYIRIFLC
jgi:Holliday junction resolvase RusA-like endonuclease